MAHKSRVFDHLLQLASTSRLKSAVTFAAVSFAVCHVIVLATTPAPGGVPAALDVEIPRQLMRLAAEFCRFALPLGLMIFGLIPGRSKQSAIP